MSRYIDADALKDYVNSISTHWLNEWDTLGVLAAIDKAKTVDVQEVKHGKWIPIDPTGYIGLTKCSECGKIFWKFNFCPNCGAKMDKESEDKTMIESTKKNDNVNHPSHYTAGGIECKDALASALMPLQGYEAFCTGNAIKYLWRWKLKNGVEDLKKAKWYIDRLIEKEERVVPEE